jgi:hypothetical protein
MIYLNRLLWVFASPSRLFADVREGRAAWWEAWIWVSLTGIVAGYLLMPASMLVIELNETGQTIDQVDAQLEFMEKWGTVLLATTPVTVLIQSLIVFGLGYITVSILSASANFKKFFTIGLFAGIVANCASLFNALIVRFRGLESIQTAADAQVSVSLAFLAPDAGVWVRSLLSSLEFFSIWALVLVAMGLMRVFDMTRNQAIACVVPLWLLFFLQRLLSVAFGGVG